MPNAYVIKADELFALNFLTTADPRPQSVDWIDRGTDKVLKPSSVEVLLRTLDEDIVSRSVARLHRNAGLRANFRTESERNKFATAFASAKELQVSTAHSHTTALFEDRNAAMRALKALRSAGVADESVSLMARANEFLGADVFDHAGHSRSSVAYSVAGGSVTGLLFGMMILALPEIGILAAIGTLATSTGSSFAVFSSIAGATGGALARMLSDNDVDGVASEKFAQIIHSGKIYVSVGPGIDKDLRDQVVAILRDNGGKLTLRGATASAVKSINPAY